MSREWSAPENSETVCTEERESCIFASANGSIHPTTQIEEREITPLYKHTHTHTHRKTDKAQEVGIIISILGLIRCLNERYRRPTPPLPALLSQPPLSSTVHIRCIFHVCSSASNMHAPHTSSPTEHEPFRLTKCGESTNSGRWWARVSSTRTRRSSPVVSAPSIASRYCAVVCSERAHSRCSRKPRTDLLTRRTTAYSTQASRQASAVQPAYTLAVVGQGGSYSVVSSCGCGCSVDISECVCQSVCEVRYYVGLLQYIQWTYM
jgi:hypothetical protein